MASTDLKSSLDHLILFLPADPETNLPKVPSFFSDNFTLTPGGVHADGLTSNTLILLADGCYIELICFLPSAPSDKVSAHWWSDYATSPGWADWCLTNDLAPEANRSSIATSHNDPIHGGRKRPDGVDVKWAVTFPRGERGLTPFFCHDTTPREVRVPLSEAKTRHPSGVLGVASLTVMVDSPASLGATRTAYKRLLADLDHADTSHSCFGTGRVVPVPELPSGAKVKLVLPRDEEDRAKVSYRGFWYGDIVLAAAAREGKPKGSKQRLDGDGSGADIRGLWVQYI
ncbi:hypothetical protein PMIN06_011296 [Paraphaeosphaeria minitans]|uniref:Glyoxalase bleomycin resistance protein dioxygenase superfamily n=1 Tax=Paraphaeosphaeria minitans TaxID=565426 RepID=A0A9P6KWM8_9PLEO|nr:glyoxalase bleomycin resistance protein dioxygenase superfamily [Paraphaeosphaeria minitans]